MVPPASHQISRVWRYSGFRRLLQTFAYGGLTLYPSASQLILLVIHNAVWRSYNPDPETWIGLGSSPFARRY